MLVSPPFIPSSTDDIVDLSNLTVGKPKLGAFPLSYDLNWHGGVHLKAPLDSDGKTPQPVRAIADGKVVFVRKPTAVSKDPKHALNYGGGWTDDGCVVIQHTTAIGANVGEDGPDVVFYSVYVHLKDIPDAVSVSAAIFRKAVVGSAGRIMGIDDQIHFEIVCDDANLTKLVGRTTAVLNRKNNGRTDVIFGALWFLIPAKTDFKDINPRPATKPPVKKGSSPPTPKVIFTSTKDQLVSMWFDGGSGFVRSFDTDGTAFANKRKGVVAEYGLIGYARGQFPNSPRAGYDLLRYGRVLDPGDTIDPNNPNNWHLVDYPGSTPSTSTPGTPAPGTPASSTSATPGTSTPGTSTPPASTAPGSGWVDLNGKGVMVYSDADFPDWDHWAMVDTSACTESRCNNDKRDLDIVKQLGLDTVWKQSTDKVLDSIGSDDTQADLARKVCKFRSEWDFTDFDTRYGWLTKVTTRFGVSEPARMTASDFTDFKAHAKALAFWSPTIGIDGVHWHFHPKSFLEAFQQCLWLSKEELAQCMPRKVAYYNLKTQAAASTTAVSNWNAALATASTWAADLNLMTRRYRIAETRQRLTHFISQINAETGYFRAVVEGNGPSLDYAPYYGRGLIQLTGTRSSTPKQGKPGNYKTYGDYRLFPSTSPNNAPPYQDLGWDPDALIATDNHNYQSANCADSAGFYWTAIAATPAKGLEASDSGLDVDAVVLCSKLTNGNVSVENVNGLDVRVSCFYYAKYELLDPLWPTGKNPHEDVTFKWRTGPREAKLDANKKPVLKNGKPVMAYPSGDITLSIPLIRQQP